jgi:methyl-accepting chemotaxis protein
MTSIRNSNTQLEKVTQIIEAISSKTSIINDIVFKTQLLSFNASIEAARAGQHGRGFAVVAEEVGSLAELSGTAAREIDALLGESAREVAGIITSLKERVKTGDDVSQEAVATFSFVTQEIGKVSEQIGEILACGQEQSKGVQQTVVAMAELNSLAQESSELSRKTNVAGSGLSKEVKNLGQVISTVTQMFLGGESKGKSAPQKAVSVKPQSYAPVEAHPAPMAREVYPSDDAPSAPL